MRTKDFYFDLPPELIAQTPIQNRDHSRLLVLNKENGEIQHKTFHEIISFLKKGDVLILNNSKVLPSRIYGTKSSGASVEFLLLKNLGENRWETLVKPGKKARVGASFVFSDELCGDIVGESQDGARIIQFHYDAQKSIYEILDRVGSMPLPPYIKEKLEDNNRYQTVYAKELGSAAAPTAGLHFTPELLKEIEQKGVFVGFVTLHVGLGTFRPVKVDKIEDHHMHFESYSIPKETIDLISSAKKENRRIISVGTTSTRTMESAFDSDGNCLKASGDTDIFIYPGYKFKVVDALITNFHLPESTLIMLVSALAGKDHVLHAYQAAVAQQYRFFSFGDAMFIL